MFIIDYLFMTKNLVIVESPAKAKTIEGFLGKDYLVKSSFGHVRDLSKKELGIDVENNFTPVYEISPDKIKVVKELKKLAKEAETVWLASDEDREGEAISWHLVESLGLDMKKVKRIVFHEITKPAILHAIETPRDIDYNLVNAQQARRVLDRLVGFELSPVLWKKVKPSLSAGRVQSVAVRLIVEREEEVRNFSSTAAYRVTARFEVTTPERVAVMTAELPKRFTTKADALKFLTKCIGAKFTIADIETTPGKKSPAAPFTTSTLQQEASRKLSFSVAKTMLVAQQLYEDGKITYMRTDSTNLSDMALGMAKKEITSMYGAEYVKIRQYTTKSKGAQEAHEAIRPTYLNQPTINGDSSQQKLYDLIWKRTVASQMADAILEKTNVTVDISTTPEKLIARGEIIKFEGFLKVYLESTDDEPSEKEENVLPPIKVGQEIGLIQMDAVERFTQQPPRYTEASLVKKLEELGIGRPSTYVPTISTIQKREYVVKEDRDGITRQFNLITLKKDKIKEEVKSEKTGFEKNKLFPTDIGSLVNKFLVLNFGNILEYNFTASVEKEFDEIAQGMKIWNDVIREFYGPFHVQVEETMKSSDRVKGERALGVDPVSKKNVIVRLGRFGPMVQIGENAENEEKPRFASLKKSQSMDTISLEEAMELFKFPRNIGQFEDTDMMVAIGRFGPYVSHNKAFYSLTKFDDPATISPERAIEIIEEKRVKDSQKLILEYAEDADLKVLNGRWGAYIAQGKNNYKIPKGKVPETLTYADCLQIIKEAPASPAKKPFKRGGK